MKGYRFTVDVRSRDRALRFAAMLRELGCAASEPLPVHNSKAPLSPGLSSPPKDGRTWRWFRWGRRGGKGA